jgi:hypothetical protein
VTTMVLIGHGEWLNAEKIVTHVDVVAARNFDFKRCMCVENTGSLIMDLMIESKDLRITGPIVGPQTRRLGEPSRDNFVREQKGVNSTT